MTEEKQAAASPRSVDPGRAEGPVRKDGHGPVFGAAPRILWGMVSRAVFKRFLGGEIFLASVIVVAELFSSLWRFLALEVPFLAILKWLALGIPLHLTEILPVALLFAITLTFSEMYSNGELTVIYSSGVSIQRLSLPILLITAVMAGGLRFFNENIILKASTDRDALYRSTLGQQKDTTVSDITIIAREGAFVYRISYYDQAQAKIFNAEILGRDGDGNPDLRVMAPYAVWEEGLWQFKDARIFERTRSGAWTEHSAPMWSDPRIDENPDSFANLRNDVKLMNSAELEKYMGFLTRSGLPAVEAELEYQKRFSFTLTPLIVCGISIAFSGLFRKNTFLMSLLFSLSVATVYYVAQMLGSLAAKAGWISPFWGIWGITILFTGLSVAGYMKAKT